MLFSLFSCGLVTVICVNSVVRCMYLCAAKLLLFLLIWLMVGCNVIVFRSLWILLTLVTLMVGLYGVVLVVDCLVWCLVAGGLMRFLVW